MKIKKCITHNCKNKARNRKLCPTCRSKKYRRENPVRYAYTTLRTNAKRRGHTFEITFDQFKQFCSETLYVRGKGKTQLSYSIDRIDESQGYTIDNIQILPLSVNSSKKNLLEKYFIESRMYWGVQKIRPTLSDKIHYPF